MRNIKTYSEEGRKHAKTIYDLHVNEMDAIKDDSQDLFEVMSYCFYLGFNAGRRQEKNRKGR